MLIDQRFDRLTQALDVDAPTLGGGHIGQSCGGFGRFNPVLACLNKFGIEAQTQGFMVQLCQAQGTVGSPSFFTREVPKAQIRFDRVSVDEKESTMGLRAHSRDDPGHIDVDHQYQVRLLNEGVSAITHMVRMVAGEVHVLRIELTHRHAQGL